MGAAKRSALTMRVARVAVLPIVPGSWDMILRSCAVAALVCLIISIAFPGISDLAAYFTLMIFACGPTSAFLPAASEPVLIAFGQLYPALMLAGIGIVAIVLVEFLNYALFDAVLHSNKLATVRDAKIPRLVIRWFALQPFLTVAIAAFSPIPFWIARSCAVLSRYSILRYMCAAALGRFWRIFLIASLGSALPFTADQVLIGGATIIVALGCGVMLHAVRRRQSRQSFTMA